MPEWIIVAVIAIVVLFGGSQIPKIARSLGSAKSEYQKGLNENNTETGTSSTASPNSENQKP